MHNKVIQLAAFLTVIKHSMDMTVSDQNPESHFPDRQTQFRKFIIPTIQNPDRSLFRQLS